MVVNRKVFIKIIGMVFFNEILEEGRYVKRARGSQNKTKINSIRALKLLNTNVGQLQINKT